MLRNILKYLGCYIKCSLATSEALSVYSNILISTGKFEYSTFNDITKVW